MPSHKNRIIIAAAGGKKTTFIVEDAIKQKDKKILITTYTIDNTEQIIAYIIEKNGGIPPNITILSWFAFLLRDGVRPYQRLIIPSHRVESIDFKTQVAPVIKGGKENPDWYLDKGNYIYRDRVSEFVCNCNSKSSGLVIKRLEKIFDVIYIDEMQDMVGWDQEFIELLLKSSISITLVGDPRQATYSTNNSRKNKATKGMNIVDWIKKLEKDDLCILEERTECFRCNQTICDFADGLYPDLPKTLSKNIEITGHDGIFFIGENQVIDYVNKYSPMVLRYDKRTQTLDLPAINIGVSKGKTYARVLIFPTGKMKEYIKTKDITQAGSIPKLYVAVTRAKYSVAFVVEL